MAWLTFALSAALAQILTNLDNFAVLLAILLPVGAGRALAGYVAAQAVMLAVALLAATGAAQMLDGGAGWLGVIPLTLGLWAVIQRFQSSDDQTAPALAAHTPVLGIIALFLSLSMDSFAVMTPLLADSTPAFRVAALTGALAAVAGMAAAALALSRLADRAGRWVHRFETLGPYAMILAGIYVLLNTGTDLVPG